MAIAVFCALAAPGFERALRLAVNHGGDSDSTGAIASGLLGAALGEGAIPARWLALLKLRQEIERIAENLSRGAPG
jgi:ADP-ribosylglycohydrolase